MYFRGRHWHGKKYTFKEKYRVFGFNLDCHRYRDRFGNFQETRDRPFLHRQFNDGPSCLAHRRPYVGATLLQLAIAIFIMTSGNPDRLSDITIFSVFSFYGLAFYAVFLLQKRIRIQQLSYIKFRFTRSHRSLPLLAPCTSS